MYDSQPTYAHVTKEGGSATPHFTHCYGGKRATVSITNWSNFAKDAVGNDCGLVNHLDTSNFCNVGCNVSNLTTKKLAPLRCSQLNEAVNHQATLLGLRAELPHLTRKDVTQIRLPFYELLCSELLAKGYHYAFSELFGLHERQNQERRTAGPESAVWYIPPLAEQVDKVNFIARHLSAAEAASTRRDAHTKFTSYLLLGKTFSNNTDDLWLAEHFFNRALEAANFVTGDDKLKLAIAHQHYGQVLQARGALEAASDSLLEFYHLTRDKKWKDDQGRPLNQIASASVVENYEKQIDQCPEMFHSDRIRLCRKARDIAAECGVWSIEAAIWHRLGQLLEAGNNLDDAYVVFRDFFDKSCALGDYQNLSKACESLAKLFQRLNKIDESIQYLLKFANSCERHGQWAELGKACQMLGTAYDTAGDYASALKWMKKAYTLPQMIQGLKAESYSETAEAARIMIGISRAHLMHRVYTKNLLNDTPPAIQRVVNWKARPLAEDKVFPQDEIQPPVTSFNNRKPKRPVLKYAEHPATGFLRE